MKKNKRVLNLKAKLKKILITVICIITVFFSMPVKSNADAGILESIASFLLMIPDGVQMLLNHYVSDETEDVAFSESISLEGSGTEDDSIGSVNDTGTLYNFEVTPYDIFMTGTLTDYGKYVDLLNKSESKLNEAKEDIENQDIKSAIINNKEGAEASTAASNMEVQIQNFSTRSMTKMPLLDANFFRKSTNDPNNSADVLRPVVANVYNNLRNFVLILMLVVLLYIGIRIIISTAVTDQVKYKQYLVDWVVGICLVFLMQYIMSAIMNINQVAIDMMSNSATTEEYVIAFGPIDSKVAKIFNDLAGVDEFIKDPAKSWRNSNNKILKVIGYGIDTASWAASLYPHVLAVATQPIFEYIADEANKVNDGWDDLQKKANKDVSLQNFIGRKLLIANSNNIFRNATWDFNENTHTVNDLTSAITGKETVVNAAIYNSKNANNGKIRARALYICNIAEFCRTITTFSSNYTNVYSGSKTTVMSKNNSNTKVNDYASAAFWGYAALYVVITIETVIFLYKYLKRVLWLAFLTMIAPLIALMYPIDKIGDGKAQTFNMWFKEYLFNTLIQPLHLLLYTIFIGVSMSLISGGNVVYGIVAYGFMIPAEKFFKQMFGFEKAKTPGGLGSPAAGMMAMRGLDKLGGFGPHGKGGSKGGKGDGKGSIPKPGYAKNKLSIPGESSSPAPGGSGKEPSMPESSGKEPSMPGSSGPSSKKNSKFKRWAGNGVKRVGGMARNVSGRVARKITGGATSSLGKALYSPKGLAAMAKTGAKFVGRNAIRGAVGLGGAVLGAGAGLLAGGLASALTGEDQIVKGISSGAAIGGNRGVQTADSARELYGEIIDSGKDYAASEDPEYAAQLQAQNIFEENAYMTDDDREKVKQIILAGASQEEVSKCLDKILKENIENEEQAQTIAFKAHLNSKFDLDTDKGFKDAIKYVKRKYHKDDSEAEALVTFAQW